MWCGWCQSKCKTSPAWFLSKQCEAGMRQDPFKEMEFKFNHPSFHLLQSLFLLELEKPLKNKLLPLTVHLSFTNNQPPLNQQASLTVPLNAPRTVGPAATTPVMTHTSTSTSDIRQTSSSAHAWQTQTTNIQHITPCATSYTWTPLRGAWSCSPIPDTWLSTTSNPRPFFNCRSTPCIFYDDDGFLLLAAGS